MTRVSSSEASIMLVFYAVKKGELCCYLFHFLVIDGPRMLVFWAIYATAGLHYAYLFLKKVVPYSLTEVLLAFVVFPHLMRTHVEQKEGPTMLRVYT